MKQKIGKSKTIEKNKPKATGRKNASLLALKKWLKKKKINKRYAIALLGIAVILNLIALLQQSRGDFLLPTSQARMAALFWSLSVVAAGVSAWFFSRPSRKVGKKNKAKQEIQLQPEAEQQPQVEQQPISFLERVRAVARPLAIDKTILFLFAILLLAFVLRVIPIAKNGLFTDEWYWLDMARLILKGVVVSPFDFIGDQPSNLPAYPLILLLLVVRNPLIAVRLTGVIYSLVTISWVYFFVKKTLGFKTAICGGILMAVSPWDIHMSTLGWLNVNPNPMLVAGVLLLLHRIWTRKHTTWTLFALAFLLAVSLHLLYVAVLLVIPAGLVLSIYWFKRRSSGKTLREIVLFGLFFFVSVSPLVPKLIQRPDAYSRHKEFLQVNVDMSGESNTTMGYYWEQAVLLAEDYFRGQTEFNGPGLWGITLDPLIQMLSVLGIVLIIIQVVRKKSDPFWLMVIFTFFIQLFVPFILLFRTSSVWRAYPILPLVYLFATYALFEISAAMKFVTREMIVKRKGLLTIFLSANMVLYFVTNLYWFVGFFGVYANPAHTYETDICYSAAKLIKQNVPRNSTVYLSDDMCLTLINILFDEDRYHLIGARPDFQLSLSQGEYVVLLNSRKFLGEFESDMQDQLLKQIEAGESELVSADSDSSPVLYLIK
jgi:hypothetical protein